MNRMSLRNPQLRFTTSKKLPIVVEEIQEIVLKAIHDE
jgi:hypothetical protein